MIDTPETKRQKLITQDGYENPVAGDYWHEMFCPYFVVLRSTADDDSVIICDEKKDVDGGWYFDLTKAKEVDWPEYREIVRFRSGYDGFVADCESVRHYKVVTDWKDNYDSNYMALERDRQHVIISNEQGRAAV